MMVVGIWLLMTVVLANAYASSLLSYLSVTKLGPVINSLEELADSKNVLNVIVQAKADITNRFLVKICCVMLLIFNHPSYKIILRKIRKQIERNQWH